jgi:hypothetical protein
MFTENSTQDEVIEAIQSGRILNFRDIPEHLCNESTAIDWVIGSPSPGIYDLDLKYEQIPLSFRTDHFMRLAATNGCNVLKDTRPDQCSIYRELARLSIARTRQAMMYLDPSFRDDEMMRHIVRHYGDEMRSWSTRIDWLIDALSDDLFDQCCKDDFMFALDAPAHRMKGDIGRYLHLDGMDRHELMYIRIRGRLDLIAAKLRDEEWPFRSPLADLKAPESMDELLGLLENSRPDSSDEGVYMACMMNEPIHVVVPAMASNRFKKLLLEMYSAEALEPFVKADTGLKGAMLEQAIGL